MKKLLLTVAALVVSGGLASAQSPPPAGCPAGQEMPPGYGGGAGYYGPGVGVSGHGFGFGFLSGLFSNHGGKGPRNVQVLPIATTGQLVFPQNPFIRGPRDYFMYDAR